MPGENLRRWVWNQQTKFTYNHRLVALVKGKCLSSKPTRLATGVVCHPDSEQNPLALLEIEPGTYCITSENFTSVPHFSISILSQKICYGKFKMTSEIIWPRYVVHDHVPHTYQNKLQNNKMIMPWLC